MEVTLKEQVETSDKVVVDSFASFTNSPTSSTSGGLSGDDLSDGGTTVPGSLIGAENYLTITEVGTKPQTLKLPY